MAGIQRSLTSQEYSTSRQIVIGYTRHLTMKTYIRILVPVLRGNEDPASLSSPSFVLPSQGVKPCNPDSPSRGSEIKT